MEKYTQERPFADCPWYKADIENALDLYEHPYTTHNVNTVLNRINENTLTEIMMDAGWAYIYARIQEAIDAGELETYEDIEPDCDDANLEMGFDPYMGCYTDEC